MLTPLIWLEVLIEVTNLLGMKCKKSSQIHRSLLIIILVIKEDKVQQLELEIEESYRLDLFSSKQIWEL